MGGLYGTTDGATYGGTDGALYGEAQTGTTTPGTTPTNGTQWRVLRDETTEADALFDAEIVDTFNPFGNYAIAYIDDTEGTRYADYPRGTRMDFQVSPDGETTYTTRFSGYVVERRERDIEGADALEVECYSFDQFLRRNTNDTDLSGQSISSALQTLIEDYTPVTWNASNVTVGDDVEVQRSYRGETVETVIRSLAASSQDERFGVTNDIEFFFGPREEEAASRDIDNTQWFDYDIPEEGKEAPNEVKVWYNDGTESVIVDDGRDKLALQDSLSTDRPVSFVKEVNFPEITQLQAAERKGEEIIDERAPTTTGTVTTYGLFDAQPGNTINIEIGPRGIDDEFRIAELEYRWGRAETVVTIVEKRGNQDDLLVRMSETLDRVEMRGADRDAIENRITNTVAGVTLTATGSVFDSSAQEFFTTAKVTNTALERLGESWANNFTFDIDTVKIGDDPTPARRTDTDLYNVVETNTVASETEPTSTKVKWQAANFATRSGIREIGLFNTNGDLLVRATADDRTFSEDPEVNINIEVANDDTVELGVVTTHGQETIADLLQGTTDPPTNYAYGDSGTTPTESDTSLGSEIVQEELDELLIQSADSDAEWTSATTIPDTVPLEITGGELALQQTCWFIEGEDWTNSDTDAFGLDSAHSDGSHALLSSSNTFIEWQFTTGYTIPEANFEIDIRQESSDFPAHTWKLEVGGGSPQTVFSLNDGTSLSLSWDNITGGNFGSSDWSGGDIPAGTHTLVLEYDSGSTNLQIDAIAVSDNRYNYTFDNTVSSGNLSGPEPYPDLVEFELDQVTTTRDVEAADVAQTWDDTTGSQSVAVSNDGGSTYTTSTNSASVSATFGSPDNRMVTKVGLSRYGTQASSPTDGANGQAIDDHSFTADIQGIAPDKIGAVDCRAIVPAGTQVGETFREGGQVDASDTLLTHVVFAAFDVVTGMRVISSERLRFRNA